MASRDPKVKCPHDRREEVWSRGADGVPSRFLGERCVRCNVQFTSDKCAACGVVVHQKADPKRIKFVCPPCVKKRDGDDKDAPKDEHDQAIVEREAMGGDR